MRVLTFGLQCFGPPPKDHATGGLPQHGFARNSTWEYLGKSSSESEKHASGGDSGVKLDFGLSSAQLSEESKKAWPYDFALVYSVTLFKDGLQTMLNVQNKGDKSFEFQMLLHTYFRVDVRVTRAHVSVESQADTFIIIGHQQSHHQRPGQHNLHRQSPRRQ